MHRLLILLLTLCAFLVAPLATPMGESLAGTSQSSAKKLSGKTKVKIATKKNKTVAKTKKRVKATYRKKSQLSARRAAQRRNMAVLNAEDYKASADLSLHSASALVLDQRTGTPIFQKNVEMETPIASITKLMTAVVTLDAGLAMSEEIEIGGEDVDRLKGTRSRLRLGSTLNREELLHLALIASENRAAAALSRSYPGGRDAFVRAMNRKAEALGMQHTHFHDGTGLSSDNRSTAADLAKLVSTAYNYPLIRRISTTSSYEVTVQGKRRPQQLVFNNTNPLTKWEKWDIGLSKTGYISEAGHCLVMQAKIAEQKVIIVLLDSWGKYSRIGDANRIRKWMEHNATDRMARSPGKEDV